MESNDTQSGQKTEPTFGGADAATSAETMPVWLSKPAPAPSAGQRWLRRIAFLGIALVTVAATCGATWLGLELYERYGEQAVVADSAQAQAAVRTAKPLPPAQADALPFAEKRTPSLPPLVMLPNDTAVKKEAGVVPADAVPAATPAPAAEPVNAAEAHKVAEPHKAAAPVVAVKQPAAELAKPVVAKKVVPPAKPVTAAAAPKKPAAAAKRPVAAPLVKAKAALKPKAPVKAASVAPVPAKRSEPEAAPAAPRKAIDRRCQPGELARECAARIE